MRRRCFVFLFSLLVAGLVFVPFVGMTEPDTVKENMQLVDDFKGSTDYDVTIAADGDESYWHLDLEAPSWTHQTNAEQVYVRNRTSSSPDYIYFGLQRFVLNIPKDATISSANITLYESYDPDSSDSQIYRVDETNPGPMEDDSSIPVRNNASGYSVYDWDGVASEWKTVSITDLVQDQVELADWVSGYYIGIYHCANDEKVTEGQWDEYSSGTGRYAYLNITYTPLNNAPQISATPTVSNADDSDNLYAQLREYQFTINVTDADGFADIVYTELALWSNARTTEYWRLRFDEDTATFSEQSDPSNMITLNATASTNTSSGNNLNVTFYVTVHWNHTDTTDTDAKVYVCDDEAQIEYFADDAKFGLFGMSFSANYPATYYYNGVTYVSWHGANAIEDDTGDPWIRTYDHASGHWSSAYRIAVNPLTDDAHGAPAIFINNSGYIHVFYGAHSSNLLQHAVSNESESVADGFTVLEEIGTDVTYPKVCYDSISGVVHLIYRWVDQGGDHDYFWRYMNSSDSGYTWSSEYTWLEIDDGGGQADGAYPYLLGPSGLDPYSRDRIHMAFAVWNETKGLAGDDNMYYAYLNLTDYHMYNAAGNDYGVISSEAELNDNFMVFNTLNYSTASSSVKVDSNHIPYILFGSEYDDGNGHNFFTYWNGTGWNPLDEICDINRYSAGGDMIVYASDNITAFLTDGEDMTRWSWDGNTWTKEETIRTVTGGRDLANALVISPYATEPEEELIMIYGEFYDDYACKGYAWNYNGNVNISSSDLSWHEVNFDIETRLDFEIGPSIDDALGTPDRGNVEGTALAFGTIQYLNSASNIRPLEGQIDVWISCTEYGSEVGPWEASNYEDSTGYFSYIVTADNEVGLDTYTFIAVEEDSGSDGTDLMHSTQTDTYISDRLVVDIQADDETPDNDQQVTFTLTITYEYDNTTCTTYNLTVYRNSTVWYAFTNGNKTLFNDTNSDTLYNYTGYSISETTHGLTALTSNTETVTWSAAATTTTTTTTTTTAETGIFYDLFLSLEMWGYLGVIGLVIIGYFLSKKDKFLGVLWFVVECLFVAKYLVLVDATPDYWWHIFILLLGGLFTCVYPLLNRQ